MVGSGAVVSVWLFGCLYGHAPGRCDCWGLFRFHEGCDPALLRVAGRDITQPVDVANEMARTISNRCRCYSDDALFTRHKATCERQPLNFFTSERISYNEPFTLAELRSAIATLRSVSEGDDQIHNDMLKHLPSCALDAVLATLNRLWKKGDFPPTWREAIMIPILKPEKDSVDPGNYRPISLTSSL